MSDRLVNDVVKSKLKELYTDTESIASCTPKITLDDGRVITLSELENAMKNAVPFCRERCMDFEVTKEDAGKFITSVENVTKSLLMLPKSDENCCVKLIKVTDFKNVKFQHAKLEGTGNAAKLKPACFKIEVPKCLPNTVQNINTGYIVDVGKDMAAYNIENGKIVKSVRTFTQKKLVIIPQILSKNKNIVPQLCARDYEDSGPYTINLLNVCGEACTIFVYLYAYKVCKPYGALRFDGKTDATKNAKVLKAKDSQDGRHVYNLGVCVLFDSGTLSADKSILEFSCFDGTKANREILPEKRLVMDNLCVFFSTRKREWCNSKLFTVSGIFRPFKEYIAPTIARESEYNINTHCCVFLESRMTLFTTEGKLNSTHVLMNGSMFDLPKYKNLKKARSAMVRNIYTLRSGYLAAKRLDSNNYDDFDGLMLIYDYGLPLTDNADLKKCYSKRNDESALFGLANKSFKRTISSRLHKNMMLLINQFVLKQNGSTDDAAVSTTNDEDTITKDSINAKRMSDADDVCNKRVKL